MSWKVRGIREAYETQNRAAESAARQFERAAIPVPPRLTAPSDAPPWLQRNCQDAASLYIDLVIAGDGILLRDAGAGMGQKRRQEALKLLRSSGVIRESTVIARTPLDGSGLLSSSALGDRTRTRRAMAEPSGSWYGPRASEARPAGLTVTGRSRTGPV